MRPRTIVLLAAGRGNRLAPLTDERPKCLVPVGGTTPFDVLLTQLVGVPVAELVIVVGHARESIDTALARRAPAFPVRTVYNPRWAEANNVVSASMAAPWAGDGLVLVNSDVICDPRIVAGAFADPDGTFLVIDPALPPRSEAMKVRYENGCLVEIAKTLDPARSHGEYIGIARFEAEGAQVFFERLEAIVARGEDYEWYEKAIAEAAARVRIGIRSTQGLPWVEIDDPADLRRAQEFVLPRVSGNSTNV